jgi:putative membrane protein
MSPPPAAPPGAFSWTTGELHPEVLVLVVLVAGAYLRAWRRHRGAIPAGPTARLGVGLAALVIATNGPLHDLAEHYLFSAHMVQHLLLTLVTPPLVLAAMPAFMLDALVDRPVVRPVLCVLTRPVPALGLHGAILAFWHVPSAYDAALASSAWHTVQHATLLGSALLAWWPVMAASRVLPALPYGAQILYLFAFGFPMTAVAALITNAESLLYHSYELAPRVVALDPLADQRLGGLIMWVPAGLIPVVAFTVVFFRWAAAERDDDPPDDAAPAAPDAAIACTK